MNDSRIYRLLTYAGAIPFMALALLPWLGIAKLGPLGEPLPLLALYGLAIASFLCGTHWTFELTRPGAWGWSLFLVSNGLVVFAWIAVGIAPLRDALAVLALVFAILLAVDGRIHARGGTSDAYWQLRRRITAIVVVTLLAGSIAA